MPVDIRTGDVFFYRGHGPISKLIRFLISVRYGIPFKNTFSHVDFAIDEVNNLSAESSGIKSIPRTINYKNNEVWAFRLTEVVDVIEEIKRIAKQYQDLHIGYAFARYILDTTRIVSFVLALLLPWFGLLSWRMGLLVFCSGAVAYLVGVAVRASDRRQQDCAENFSEVYERIGVLTWKGWGKARNTSPNGVYNVICNMCAYGAAKCIGYKSITMNEMERLMGDEND
jgi:hypothetical protein